MVLTQQSIRNKDSSRYSIVAYILARITVRIFNFTLFLRQCTVLYQMEPLHTRTVHTLSVSVVSCFRDDFNHAKKCASEERLDEKSEMGWEPRRLSSTNTVHFSARIRTISDFSSLSTHRSFHSFDTDPMIGMHSMDNLQWSECIH